MFLKKLDPALLEALAEAGLEQATDFQKQCIARIKAGGDLIGLAPNQSGKSTLAVVAVVQQLKAELDDVPRAIVLVENKQRGEELKGYFDLLAKHTSLRIHEVYETQKMETLKDKVYFGTDVVVGTPLGVGRLYSNNGLNLNEVKLLLIDDAHRTMIDKNLPQVDRLAEALPRAQRIVLCQRMTDRLARFADRYMNFPPTIEATEPDQQPDPQPE